jgi:radical SAM protein with 4Fe4S-binding SPASM domain
MAPPLRHRFETFGGIIASETPPFLAFVDRQLMRELGLGESARWAGGDERIGVLSAPTEVHVAATSACPVGCNHCYMDAGPRAAREMDGAAFARALAVLAHMGVFHIALGGGEALTRPDLFELAALVRRLGMVPNLTISGQRLTPEAARRMTVFGQVNVSVDGVGEYWATFRDAAGFAAADQAIDWLLAAGVATGINCVLGARNFPGLPDLFAYGRAKGVSEIELLRYKPVGRAASPARYLVERMGPAENVALVPLVTELGERHRLTAKIDCSFVPMMCYHRPPLAALEATATYGCEAGNVLLGARSDGSVSGCSFLPATGLSLFDLPERWADHPDLVALRSWPERAPEPCRSCEYLGLCKGGCHAVAALVSGDLALPDPDCPWVVEHGEGLRARAAGGPP